LYELKTDTIIHHQRKVMTLKRKHFMIAVLSGLSFLAMGHGLTANAKSDNAPTIANVVFKPTNETNLTNYVYDTVDPNSQYFHHYLSPGEFAQKFGQSDRYVAAFKTYLKKYHVKADVYGGNLSLKVSGTRNNVNRAFNAKSVTEKRTHKSRTTYKLPAHLSNHVLTVMGLYQSKPTVNKPVNRQSHSKKALTQLQSSSVSSPTQTDDTKPDTTISGDRFSKKYGALKFAKQYQLTALYDKGLKGQGQRIGIISSGDFHNSDLTTYWKQAGVNNDLSHIHKIYTVDSRKDVQKRLDFAVNGAQIEATLDVQAASSVAPKADIDFYIGDSTDDLTNAPTAHYMSFMQAISDNIDQQLSTSFAPTAEVQSRWHDYSATMAQYNHAFNLMLEQAAAQGITVFRASGDNGPRDDVTLAKENHAFSTSPYQVIVGGTTLPYTKTINHKVVTVAKECAWGSNITATPAQIEAGKIGGSGGGFSALNPTPRYQQGISGVNTFRAIELLKIQRKNHKYTISKHPKIITGINNGRNLPDVAGNADIQTGYALYFSGNQVRFKQNKLHSVLKKVWMMDGGTSYTSPQMAAANAVMNSGRTTSIGFWNPQIYKFAQQADSPFTVLDGMNNHNLYYTGQPGKLYNQATGLGTIDFDKLSRKFDQETNDK
jgi:subtilase family serine protease